MRRLLESLMPDGRQIYWKWVGGMFALYVVLMGTAASVFVNHESTRKLAQEPATLLWQPIAPSPRSRRPCGKPRDTDAATGVQTPIALRATTSR